MKKPLPYRSQHNAFAPREYLKNISFLFKLLGLLLAGLNLLAFHVTGMNRAVDRIGASQHAPLAARLMVQHRSSCGSA